MLDFIIKNYYVILVVCILLIFAIIGYIIDSLKNNKYLEINQVEDTYVPEEEVFIQKFEEQAIDEEENENIDDLLEEYNEAQKENDSE